MVDILPLRMSKLGILEVIVIALLLFFALKLIRRSFVAIINRRNLRLNFQQYFPIFEVIMWLIYSYWALKQIIIDSLFYTISLASIMLIFLIWISWFALKDLIAGLILKVQDVYIENQRIRISDVHGIIRKVGLLNIEVELESGEIAKVPYSKITGEVHSKSGTEERRNFYKFNLDIAKKLSLNDTIEKLRLCILNSPWAVPNKEPLIKHLNISDDKFNFEVIIFTLSSEYFQILEQHVKIQMGE